MTRPETVSVPTPITDDEPAESATVDVVIVGGGPVGLIAALALSRLRGLEVVLVEREPLDSTVSETPAQTAHAFDGRVLALTRGSCAFLDRLGLTASLAQHWTQITQVHVSQKGFMGISQLSAQQMQVSALGYSIEGRHLGALLWQHVEASDKIQVYRPATLAAAKAHAEGVDCDLQSADGDLTSLKARLLIGADGTQSTVRQLFEMPIETKSYDAVAVLSQIHFEQPHRGVAYERFCQQGPVALLPMDGDQGKSAKAVWVMSPQDWATVQHWDEATFLKGFSQQMGERMGAYQSVSARMAYPLKETVCPQLYQTRVLLLGNAAHTQHPVAAQGLNLGIDDVRQACEALSDTDVGATLGLYHYAQQRQAHYQTIMGMTDRLIDLFGHSAPMAGHLRGLGLMAVQFVGPIRRQLMRTMMGAKK